MAGTPVAGAAGAAGVEDPARVVVVDDDTISGSILEAILLRDGCWVRTFSDPLEAFEAMVREPPDVLISDWLMPGLDGPDLLKKIRADPQLQGTYCILVTAHDQAGRKVTGLLVGADDYLPKPVSEMELLARIRVGMRVRRLERQAMLLAMTAALAHEVNNPLTAVLGYVDLLRSHMKAGQSKEAMDDVTHLEKAATRIQAVVSRFMEIQSPVMKEYRPGTRMLDLGGSGPAQGPPAR
jgi:DNA-binding response OmpR family regulator